MLNVEASQLRFRIFGGPSWIDGGDLNRNIRGWDNYFEDRNKAPYSFDYSVKELHFQWEGGVEVIYRLSSRFHLALGAELLTGTIHGEMTSSLDQEQDYFNSSDDYGTIFLDEQSVLQPRYSLRSIPLTLTIYYFFPAGKRVNFFLGCGGGFYLGKITYEEEYEYTFDYRDEKYLSASLLEFVDQYSSSGTYLEESTSHAIGFHAKSGLELKIRQDLLLFIEVQGRWANYSDWKGSWKDEYAWDHTWGYWGANFDRDSSEDVGEGKLWMVEFESDETGKSYPRFIFSKEKPVGSSYSGMRPAKINLSGVTVRVGIRLSFD